MAKEFIQGKMKASDLAKLGVGCAYNGCTEHKAAGESPPGWCCMLLWEGGPAPHGTTVIDVVFGPNCWRDAALCPKHAKEIDGLLYDLGRRLERTEGNA